MVAAANAAKRMERKENIFFNKRMWFGVTDISRETTNVLLEMLNEKIKRAPDSKPFRVRVAKASHG